ncbi:MAG: magnesium protoporphyrin IX methyltransferase [Proteobacteria bacterium]|nr:magnesium protoporphyrin IX methyltransferase [Pseudomonadota bacterium]
MPTLSYIERRKELQTYFDRTAVDAWSKLTSEAPVGRIRATVREGRAQMRHTLVSWLPDDLTGRRILDAGCGAGNLSIELAARGADVVGIDLSPTLIELARERHPGKIGKGSVEFRVGDMLRLGSERFDHAVAMDSLIHYEPNDMAKVIALMGSRIERTLLFTFIPRTPALVAMHTIGKLFPKGDRSPRFRPLGEDTLRGLIRGQPGLSRWQIARTARVARGFYISEGMELVAS